MTATIPQAIDDILTLFKTAWDLSGYPLLYENVGGELPTTQTPWARISIRHFRGAQETLGGTGERKFSRGGLVIVQTFTAVGGGLSEPYNVAKIAADALEGKSTSLNVWFRNVRINEIGVDGDWFQVNVLADFTYDEMK